MLKSQEVLAFLKAAAECSVYIAPTDYGLTPAEIMEAATRAGFLEGEIRDALAQPRDYVSQRGGRYQPGREVIWSQSP
jgi:hypothetical protein